MGQVAAREEIEGGSRFVQSRDRPLGSQIAEPPVIQVAARDVTQLEEGEEVEFKGGEVKGKGRMNGQGSHQEGQEGEPVDPPREVTEADLVLGHQVEGIHGRSQSRVVLGKVSPANTGQGEENCREEHPGGRLVGIQDNFRLRR